VARTPTTVHTPSASCTTIAARLATTDLRSELEYHRSGEDGRTTIERRRERRCNLDGDYDAVNVTPMGMMRTPLLLRDLGVDAWHLPQTFEWWSDHASSSLIC
jgi:hypothetical protein